MAGAHQTIDLLSSAKFFCHHCCHEVPVIHATSEDHNEQVLLVCQTCQSSFVEEITDDDYLEDDYNHSNSDEDQYGDSESHSDADSDGLYSSFHEIINRELSQGHSFSRAVRDVLTSGISDNVLDYVDSTLDHTDADSDSEYILIDSAEADELSTDSVVDALTSQLLDEVVITGPPPLSKDEIKLLPVVHVTKELIEKDIQCTVCMEDFRLRQKLKRLPCSHLYHNKCIAPWLQKQSSCPNCREIVSIGTRSSRSRSSSSRSSVGSRSSDDDYHLPGRSSISDFFTTSINPFRLLL